MYLLKKINTNSNFIFSKILIDGYDIQEQPNTISKVQFVNGNRKRIYTNYEDCIIKINLGGLDSSDLSDYLANLIDGEYEYYSFEHGQYKTANFLITKPSIVANSVFSTNNYFINDLEITLEKSSDVETTTEVTTEASDD